MISIVNVSKNISPFGEHCYEVRINNKVITNFIHKREDGLHICLKKASEAVARHGWENLKIMLDNK